MKKSVFYILLCFTIFLYACIKEFSYETGSNILGNSEGTLKDSVGNCQGIVVMGNYHVDSVLTDSNYILVKVNVTKSGQYKIHSDTVNGFWFWDSSYVTAGQQTLKVKGHGKPILEINTDFDLYYNNSYCSFTVQLVPPPPTVIYRDYFPTTIGSNWCYDVTGSTDTMHIESSTKDSVIGGNSYHIFYGVQGLVKDTGYYYKNSGEYYRYDALDVNSGRMSLLFINESKPVLSQWDGPISTGSYLGIPTDVKMHFTVIGVNISRTVNGNSFDSVIQMKNEMQYKVLGTFTTVATIDAYYAKNVGLIEFNVQGLNTMYLRRWKVY